jgi:hypothetical protein
MTKFLRVLLACGKCYAQNTRFTTVIIDKPDWPSTLRYWITSKDSTDTFIEQVEFTQIPTDSSGKARRKRIVYRYMLMKKRIVYRYMLMNNPIDF